MEAFKLYRRLSGSLSFLLLLLITTIIFFFSINSFAFYVDYDYFSTNESRELNSPRQIGSEYESDRLAYQFLSSWHYDWLKHQNIFQYTAGSLGPTRFYTQGRFRFIHEISEDLKFQISYNERGDYKSNRQALVFEFFYSPLNWLNLSVYGSPNSLKKEDDVGLASTFLFSETSNLRLFYTLVDFTHNKRNEDTDTYSQEPASYGFVFRSWENDVSNYIQASLKQDKKIQQNFSNGRIYSFAATMGQFLVRQSIDPQNSQFLQGELNFYKGHEEDTVNTDQGIARWNIQSVDALIQYENQMSRMNMLGIRFNYAQWDSSQGSVIHNDLLPHVWFKLLKYSKDFWSHHLDLGYEFTWHRAQGPFTLRSTLDTKNDVLEHRLNVRYQAFTSKNTQLNLLLSFDIDRFGTGETWEGGSMQYSVAF